MNEFLRCHDWALVGSGHLSLGVDIWIEIQIGKINERRSYSIDLQNFQTKKIGVVHKIYRKRSDVICSEETCTY